MKRYIIAAALIAVGIPALAAEIGSLDAVDASNTARFPENMSPGAVNDGARALEGIMARWAGDESCVIQTTGTSSVWSLSATRTLSSYYDGLKVCFDAHTDNDGAVTLNVDAVGAAALVRAGGTPLVAGDIRSGEKVEAVYDGTNWQIISSIADSTVDAIIQEEGDLIIGDDSGLGGRIPLGSGDTYLYSDGATMSWSALPTASTTVTGVQENADQSDMESEATTRTVTPDQVEFNPYVAKAWVYVTMSGANIDTITGQNVTTVSDDGQGVFTVDFTDNFSSANIACTVTTVDSALTISRFTAVTAGGVSIENDTSGGTNTDPDAFSVVCFGDR